MSTRGQVRAPRREPGVGALAAALGCLAGVVTGWVLIRLAPEYEPDARRTRPAQAAARGAGPAGRAAGRLADVELTTMGAVLGLAAVLAGTAPPG